jgi:hypothetical protein
MHFPTLTEVVTTHPSHAQSIVNDIRNGNDDDDDDMVPLSWDQAKLVYVCVYPYICISGNIWMYVFICQ